ncbi:MAG: LysR family transcriptional regulator [Alphaproteobacteria bacterium]|nr:LysR family transcriptional regulator [Alphaproteobacteria bacterium]
MDWDKARVFHAVAQAGSFTHAGTVLGLSQSAVSRQVSSLESSLGVPLFHRHARGLLLTEAGERLYETTQDVFSKLALAELVLKESTERPAGKLKVTATTALGATWLTPRIREFLDRYPEIELELLLDDRGLDLAMREADIAIRLREPVQLDLVRRPLFTLRFRLFATKAYLDANGRPESARDLLEHDIIGYTRLPAKYDLGLNWHIDELQRGGAYVDGGEARIEPRLVSNNFISILRAIEAGVGIGPLPDYLAADSDELECVLGELKGPDIDIFLVYPEELRGSKRVSAFRDFLVEKAKDWPADPAAAPRAARLKTDALS